MYKSQTSLVYAKNLSIKLKDCMSQLEDGKFDSDYLIVNLQDASEFLEQTFINRSPTKDEDIFSNTESELPENVQEWISSTFTMRTSLIPPPRKRLRSLVNAVRVGIFFDRAYRKVSLPGSLAAPEQAIYYLKQNINSWDFDIFHFNNLTHNHSLKIMAYELLHSNQLINRFNMDPLVLEAFLDKLQEGYSKYQNPYHNLIHAADVAHTSFLLVSKTRLFSWISDLELLGLLLSALIHDFEHTGTTNNFHINTRSKLALIYNDKSVLENYHISASFRLLRDEQYNILSALTPEEYKELRSMTIDMVLATDMTAHFNQVQTMKENVLVPENMHKLKIIAYVLHSADISHPCKSWELHEQWTKMVVEEFFRQGDIEREAGMTCSPLCDRHSTLVPESQIGFINFIVEPCFNVLCDVMTAVSVLCPSQSDTSDDDNNDTTTNNNSSLSNHNNNTPSNVNHTTKMLLAKAIKPKYPWKDLLASNKSKWGTMIQKKNDIPTIEEEEAEEAD